MFYPGSRVKKKESRIPAPHPDQGILIILIQKLVSKLSKIRSKMFIRILIFYPSRIPGSKRHRIPDPDSQSYI